MKYFEKIDRARKLLGLPEESSILELEETYRINAVRYHPDRCPEGKKDKCREMFKASHDAYELLLKYCRSYKITFTQRDIENHSVEREREEHMRKFYDDWII